MAVLLFQAVFQFLEECNTFIYTVLCAAVLLALLDSVKRLVLTITSPSSSPPEQALGYGDGETVRVPDGVGLNFIEAFTPVDGQYLEQKIDHVTEGKPTRDNKQDLDHAESPCSTGDGKTSPRVGGESILAKAPASDDAINASYAIKSDSNDDSVSNINLIGKPDDVALCSRDKPDDVTLCSGRGTENKKNIHRMAARNGVDDCLQPRASPCVSVMSLMTDSNSNNNGTADLNNAIGCRICSSTHRGSKRSLQLLNRSRDSIDLLSTYSTKSCSSKYGTGHRAPHFGTADENSTTEFVYAVVNRPQILVDRSTSCDVTSCDDLKLHTRDERQHGCQFTDGSGSTTTKCGGSTLSVSGDKGEECHGMRKSSSERDGLKRNGDRLKECVAEIDRLRLRNKSLQERLSKQVYDQLGSGERSGRFENLSLGANRPSILIRRYENLYTDARQEAMDVLDCITEDMESCDDQFKEDLLMFILQKSFQTAAEITEDINSKLSELLQVQSRDLDSLTDVYEAVMTFLRVHIEERDLSSPIQTLCDYLNQLLSPLSMYNRTRDPQDSNPPSPTRNIATLNPFLRRFVEECVTLAWALTVQRPSYVVNPGRITALTTTDLERGNEVRAVVGNETKSGREDVELDVGVDFNVDRHTRFHSSDPESSVICRIVWPALVERSTNIYVYKAVVVT